MSTTFLPNGLVANSVVVFDHPVHQHVNTEDEPFLFLGEVCRPSGAIEGTFVGLAGAGNITMILDDERTFTVLGTLSIVPFEDEPVDLTLEVEDIPNDFPVRPLTQDDLDDQLAIRETTCGTCDLSWDDAIPTGLTPVPSGRCPFEQFHVDEG